MWDASIVRIAGIARGLLGNRGRGALLWRERNRSGGSSAERGGIVLHCKNKSPHLILDSAKTLSVITKIGAPWQEFELIMVKKIVRHVSRTTYVAGH